MVRDAFENIHGQPQVREYLRSMVTAERVSHAYLFTGPAGSNKTQAAFSLAQAVLCPKGPNGPRGGECGACDICRRVARRTHPDVHYVAPAGASGYLVEQVREVVADVSRKPIQAKRKIYVLDRVDLLGTSAANAFLKTLEEPPRNVLLVLLARTRESVLPTIVSRCQVVPFRHIPASEAAAILGQNTGAAPEIAQIAIQACGGSITKAAEFLRSNERLAFRQKVLDVLASLLRADDWDLLGYAQQLVLDAKAPLDVVRAAQEAELEENADFLAKSAVRQIEQRNKRALSAAAAESLAQLTAIVRSWLRDLLATCAETPQVVVNVDVRNVIEEAAARTDEARIVRALSAVQRCDEALSYNVSPETCIGALLFEVKEELYGSGSPR